MPVAVAFFVRQLLIIAVQLAIFWAIDKFVTPYLNVAIKKIMTTFGVDEQTATDILANEIITTAETLGMTVALSKAKLPLTVAEKLGFTSKGYKVRKLATATEAKIATAKGTGKIVAPTAASVGVEAIEIIAKSRGVAWTRAQEILKFVATLVGIPVGTLYMIAQYIDFGNWNSGAFQTQFQTILSFFGLEPDKKIPSSEVLSKDTWDKVYATYKEMGAVGINNPYVGQTRLFSREQLILLVDKVAAQLLLDGQSNSVKNIIGATQLLIIFKKPDGTTGTGGTAGTSLPITAGGAGVPSAPTVKVFTGIISNGVLGAGLEFVPRQDDLIENMGELQEAINNNLAPFLISLPSKIVYEVKIVSSYIDASGIKHAGEAQTIQTGVYSDGRPKTKTLINKWAVVYLYAVTDKNTRSKIKTIVLGPTDAVKFRPDGNTLNAISQVIPQSAITLKTTDIQNLVPNEIKEQGVDDFARAIGVPEERINQATGEIIDPTPAEVAAYNYQFATTPAPAPAVQTPADKATTLYEWYTAQGQKLPTLADRAILYEKLKLGQRALYAGTAEQNTRLLNELKKPAPKPEPIVATQAPAITPQGYQAAPSGGFFRPPRGTPVYAKGSGASLGLADGNTDYNSEMVRV